MTFWYTAKNIFSPINDGTSWEKYIEWSKLTQLEELVSLDTMLCELMFDPDYDNVELYDYIICDQLQFYFASK